MGLTQRELCPERVIAPFGLHTFAKQDSDGPSRWYALMVKHQHERRIGDLIHYKGFETLVPLYRVRRPWSDRTAEIDLPLFGGYVFCRFDYQERVRLLATPGVRKIVGFGAEPAAIPHEEIAAIQAVVRSTLPMRPWPYLRPGDKVRVERGPLRGLEGTLLREKDSLRLIVGIEMLQRSIAAELEPEMVAPARMWRAASSG